MSQWNSEEDAAKAVTGGGWSNGPGHQQTKNSQPTAMETGRHGNPCSLLTQKLIQSD